MSVERIGTNIEFAPQKGLVQLRVPNTPFAERSMPEVGQWWHGKLITVDLDEVTDGKIYPFYPRIGMFITPNDGTGTTVEMDKNETHTMPGAAPYAIAVRELIAQVEMVTIFTKADESRVQTQAFIRENDTWIVGASRPYTMEDLPLYWSPEIETAARKLETIPKDSGNGVAPRL